MKRITALVLALSVLCLPMEARRRWIPKIATAVGTAVATDNFTRANSDPVSNPMSDGVSTWTTTAQGTFGTLQITANQAAGSTGADCSARATAPTFTGQHYSEFTVVVANGATYFGPGIRGTSGGNGYAAYVNGSTTQIIIAKATGGSFATLQTYTVTALVAGDVIRLEGTGTGTVTLTLKINGATQGSPITDSSSPYTGGQPWLYINSTGTKCSLFHAADF